MPHKEHLSFRELDRLMRSVPNFTLRRHGIVCKREYTAKDCDCRYCSHYSGRGRKPGCTLDRCEYMRERIVAESATYRETVAETMSTVHYPPFVRRINQLLQESEETSMNYFELKRRKEESTMTTREKRRSRPSLTAGVVSFRRQTTGSWKRSFRTNRNCTRGFFGSRLPRSSKTTGKSITTIF